MGTINVDADADDNTSQPYQKIQTAIDNADSSDTIDVAAGTYDESVTIDVEGLTLKGPNSGIAGDDSSNRSNEATLRRTVTVDRVSDVTIKGFKIAEDGTSLTSGVSIRSGNSDIDPITVKDNIISGMSDSNSSDFTFGILSFDNPMANGGTLSNATVKDNKISDIGVDGSTQGVAVSLEALTGSSAGDGAIIENNSISDISTLDQSSPGTGIALRPNFGGGSNGNSAARVTDDNSFKNVDISVSHPEGDNVTESLTNVATVVVDDTDQPHKQQRIFTPTIQNAINAAGRRGADRDDDDQNDVINVRQGTYNESVRVDTADLTLNGPNSGTPGDDSDNRSNEATLRRKVIVNRVSGVTIDGFKIAEGGTSLTSGVSIRSGSNDIDSITVKNNIISGMSDSNSSDFTFGILSFDNPKTNAGTLSNATVRDNKISDIGVDNSTQGVAISLEALTGSNGNTRVDGNSIKNISTLNEGSPGTGIALRPNFGGSTNPGAEVTDDNTFENVDIAVSHPEGDNVTESLTNVATVVVNRNGGRQRIFTPTIQNAVDAAERDGANTNDEIEIRGRDDGGAYNERVVLNRDDDNSGRLTLTSPHNITPEIAKSDSGGEPTIAVDRDGVTIEDLKITRTATDDRVAQAVRVAGDHITLKNNDCKVKGPNNAVIGIFTDSSGAAGNPDFTGQISSVTIDGGTITAGTDSTTNNEVGVLVADNSEQASFSEHAVTTAASDSPVTFEVHEGNDHVVELDTDGGVVDHQNVLLNNNNTFETKDTSATAASPDRTDETRGSNGEFSVKGLIASTVQDAVEAAAASTENNETTVDVLSGTFNEKVRIGKNITLTEADDNTSTPTISGQVRITGAVSGSSTLEVSELDIEYDPDNAGSSGKKSTVLFEQTDKKKNKRNKENITIKNNTITGPEDGDDGFVVYKRKSSGKPDNNITFKNNTFDAGPKEVNQLVVIEAASGDNGEPNTVDVIGENSNQEFKGTLNRGNSPGDNRGVALDHRATSGSIKNNDFDEVTDGTGSSTDFEPIASATGDNTSIKENGDGGNIGLDFEGESAAGNNLQTELNKNRPGEAVRIINASSEEFKINAKNGTNQNTIQIPDNLGADVDVTIKGSNETDDPELQVPDDGTGIEVNESDTTIKDLSIEGLSESSGTAIDVGNSNTTIKDVKVGSGSAPETGVKINGSGCTLRDSTINNTGTAIDVSSDDTTIENVEIGSGSAPDTGVRINNSGCTLRDSTITVNPTAAIKVDGDSNSVIEDNRLKAASPGGAGILISDSGSSGNLIALNNITGSDSKNGNKNFKNGIKIKDGAKNVGNVKIRFNNIRGSNAIDNSSGTVVDARSNFWNDKTGPSSDGVDDPNTGRTANGEGDAISDNGNVRYDEFLEISNEFILNTGSPPDGRDTDDDELHEDFNDDSDHFPTDGYLFLRALRQGHFDRLAAIDNPGGDLSENYTESFDFDGDGADDITRDDVNEMVINRNR